ncbi:alpha/beta-hydrolase [Setomelanomma holmii]|uniref:Carboxylic ester hydrolase n=1 Tax=Setomelanomma holmii TaxID=210430 RepID=A0A9P4HIG5_9PLEO|nr:alpha/beta-hydrolase [Setomelanomma holmii]
MACLMTALLGVSLLQVTSAVDCLEVKTTSGNVTGFLNETTPHVAQFLGIPFAQPPTRERRWLPALPITKPIGHINATRFGPICPQYETDVDVAPNVYTVDTTDFTPAPFNDQSEDCLSLSIWAPWDDGHSRHVTKKGLPVILWIYGGGFGAGAINIPYTTPDRWVERSGKHIVVSINYRIGIFGFPTAAGLKYDEQNLGLLDQRLALEWTRDNIASFGGDPKHITIWGQSAGAMSVDYLNFAYPKDPIAASLIMNSGTATLSFLWPDPEFTNFTFVAKQFGCNDTEPKVQLECLRKVDASDITLFLKYYAQNGTDPGVAFVPLVDNRTVFENHTARALAGNMSHVPAIIGNTADEGTSFTLPYNQTYGPDLAVADATTVGLFMCPTIQTSHDRYAANRTTFRYLYAGNFSNISPQWWEGAYHSSDLPMIFGTYGLARGNGTEFQKQVSEKMQDLWVAFAENPVDGLPKMEWNAYENGAGAGVLFGYEDQVVQPIAESSLDGSCDGLVPNGLPPPPR